MRLFSANGSAPHWRHSAALDHRQLPTKTRRWLLSGASTSRLMTEAMGGAPEVRRLSQHWRRPAPAEARFLGFPPRRSALVREVEIHCRGERWMLARTVFPPRTLRINRDLNLSGAGSIGQVLFKQPSMRRSPFQVARLYGAFPGLSDTLRWPETVWGRRSLFWVRGAPLLLSETFLPNFSHWLEHRYGN